MVKEDKFYELATIGGLSLEEAYDKAYNCKSRKSMLTHLASKKKRDPELFERIEKYKSELFIAAVEVQREEVRERAKKNAITQIEKREILRKIMMGEQTFSEHVIVDKTVKLIHRLPTPLEVIRAIGEDNRMAGDYAQTGIKHDDNNKKWLEFMGAVSKRKMDKSGKTLEELQAERINELRVSKPGDNFK